MYFYMKYLSQLRILYNKNNRRVIKTKTLSFYIKMSFFEDFNSIFKTILRN